MFRRGSDALTRTIATSYTSPPTPTAETQTAAGRQRPEKVEVPAYGPTRTGRTVVPLAPYDACRSRLKRLSTRASEGHRVNPQSPRAPAAQVEHSGLVSLV